MKKRESGIDLLRLIASLFVVGFHSFLYNGYYYHPQHGAAMLFFGSARWLFTSCNGIFLMLTGYLLAQSRFHGGIIFPPFRLSRNITL